MKMINVLFRCIILMSTVFLSGCLWNITSHRVRWDLSKGCVTELYGWRIERRSVFYVPNFFYIEYFFSGPNRINFFSLLGEFVLRSPTMLIEFLYNSEVDYDYPFAVNTAVRFDSKKKEALSFLNDVEGGSCEIALAGKKVLRVPYIIQKDKYSPPIPGKISYSMLFVDSDNNLWIQREIDEENLWFINYGEEIQEGDVMIMRISLNDGAITPILEIGKDGEWRIHSSCPLEIVAKDRDKKFWLYGLSGFLSD